MNRLGDDWRPVGSDASRLTETIQASIHLVVASVLRRWFPHKSVVPVPPTIVVSDSPSFVPVTYLEQNGYFIEIPVGFFYRTWLLIHLTARQIPRHADRLLISGHQNDRDDSSWYLPKRFRPIFEVYETSAVLHGHVARITRQLPLPKGLANVHILAVKYAVLAVVHHELSHIILGHVPTIESVRLAGRLRQGSSVFTGNEVRTIFELDADVRAAKSTLDIALSGWGVDLQISALVRGWLAVLCLFDTPARFLGDFEGTNYCHPTIRYEFIRGAWDYHVNPDARDQFCQQEEAIWRETIYCFDSAVLESIRDSDVRKNVFGPRKTRKTRELLPLHSFKIGHTGMALVNADYDRCFALVQRYWQGLPHDSGEA